jgi:hypothetical protein
MRTISFSFVQLFSVIIAFIFSLQLAQAQTKSYGPKKPIVDIAMESQLKRTKPSSANTGRSNYTGIATQFLDANGNWIAYENSFVLNPDSSLTDDKLILSEETKSLLKTVRRLLEGYGVFDSAPGYRHISEFFDRVVIERGIYKLVEKTEDLYELCPSTEVHIPTDEEPKRTYGCTDKDGVTYLVRPNFAAFDIRHSALGIIHERLHVYCATKSDKTGFTCAEGTEGHTWLKEFVAGTNVLLELYAQ